MKDENHSISDIQPVKRIQKKEAESIGQKLEDVPEREADCEIQTKGLPEQEVREEEPSPRTITIEEAERKKNQDLRCPLDADLACIKCRWFEHFPEVKGERTCAVIRVAHWMPL